MNKKLHENYNQFILENLLMESIKEMKFVLSKRFIEVISKINSDITDELLKSHNDLDFNTKQTFIDICVDSDDSVSFILAGKAADVLEITTEEELQNPELQSKLRDKIPATSEVYSRYRGTMKLGRFINTVFPNKFPSSLKTELGKKIQDVEGFVRSYKSKFGQETKFKMFDIVSGKKVAYWYKYTHYANRSGSLGGSCMSNVDSSYQEIFVDNPEKVQLLILHADEGKKTIKGRALLWNLVSPEGRIYMDRIYTNNSGDEQLFQEFAKSQGWLYKAHQRYGSDSNTVDGLSEKSTRLIMKSELNHTEYNRYPYMDSMVFYQPRTGIISNSPLGAKYSLLSTGGGKDNISGQYATVYSKYHKGEIMERDAKYCKLGDDYVNAGEATRVWNTGLGEEVYAVPGYPDIVRCYIKEKNKDGKPISDKYFLKSRCVWSDYLNTWVFENSVIPVFMDEEKTKTVLEHKKRENAHFAKIGEEYFHVNLCKKVRDKWYLKSTNVPEPEPVAVVEEKPKKRPVKKRRE